MGPFKGPIVSFIIVLPKLTPLGHLPNIRTSATLQVTGFSPVTNSDLIYCELGSPGQVPHRNLKPNMLNTLAGYLSPLGRLPPMHPIFLKDTIIP